MVSRVSKRIIKDCVTRKLIKKTAIMKSFGLIQKKREKRKTMEQRINEIKKE